MNSRRGPKRRHVFTTRGIFHFSHAQLAPRVNTERDRGVQYLRQRVDVIVEFQVIVFGGFFLRFSTSLDMSRNVCRIADYSGSYHFDEILSIFGREHRRDALHVDSAFKSGCSAFITQDSDILKHKARLEGLLGIRFFHPDAELSGLEQFIAGDSGAAHRALAEDRPRARASRSEGTDLSQRAADLDNRSALRGFRYSRTDQFSNKIQEWR